MSFRFIHTADWQLGKPFSSVPGDPGAALRIQRLETVAKVAALAVEHDVDAVLVAGDVFDDNEVSDETLRRTMNTLGAFAGLWVLLPGNHDAATSQSVWQRLRTMGIVPGNVVLADSPDPVELAGGAAVVLPAPLQRRHEVRDLTEWFEQYQTPEPVIRIGLAHGSMTRRLPESAESMNPIAEGRAVSARLDYLALGDWHGMLEIADRSWYSGTPEPDRFKDNTPGNVLLVEISEPGGRASVTPIGVGEFQWHMLSHQLLDDTSIDALQSQLEEWEEQAYRRLVRLTLTGSVTLSQRLRIASLLDEWQARFHYLDVRDADLAAQPSEDDIAAMDASGFVRSAVDALVEIQSDETNPDHEDAGLALQLLYMEQEGVKQ